jgi:hypothetical protein
MKDFLEAFLGITGAMLMLIVVCAALGASVGAVVGAFRFVSGL